MEEREDPFGCLLQLERSYKQSVMQEPAQDAQSLQQWLLFHAGQQQFAFLLSNSVEILTSRELVHLPWVQPWVKGLLSHHGELFPVIELGRVFSAQSSSNDSAKHLLLIKEDNFKRAFLIQPIIGVQPLRSVAHQACNDEPSHLRALCPSIITVNQQQYYLLTTENLLSFPLFCNLLQE